jgi:hypothetical protein
MLWRQRKQSQHSTVYHSLRRGSPQCKTFKWFPHIYWGCRSNDFTSTLTFLPLTFCSGVAVDSTVLNYLCLLCVLLLTFSPLFVNNDFIYYYLLFICISLEHSL